MQTEIHMNYPGGAKRVDTRIGDFTVQTDSSKDNDGDGLFPSPGQVYLAGLGACTASTIRGYCRRNNLPLPLGVTATVHKNDETGVIEKVDLEIQTPPDFPAERLEALLRAAEACTVKKFWLNPPQFSTTIRK